MGLQWKKDESEDTFYNGTTGNYVFFDADLGKASEDNTNTEDDETDDGADAEFDESQEDLDDFKDEDDFDMND